jgi:myo-inositol 2-dehydrogenase/D-chiro-inositol 1-dehydrogenase
MKAYTRRSFLKTALAGGTGLMVLPTIAPRSLFGAVRPNSRIQFAQIGCGRMGSGDMESVMAHDLSRLVAVCDLDSKRAQAARDKGVSFYKDKAKGSGDVDITVYHDFHEVLARPDIDAVVVSTPDHWHALVAIQAALAGKAIYVQKPVTYAIAEAMALRDVVGATRVIAQTGSQQRSEHPYAAFRAASEAVRNGRIGTLKTIKIGIGLDKPKGKAPAPMPVPANLDFQTWLGPAPEQPYMEERVHPQSGYGRPGWITTEDFGLGMITNWGAHHIDIAHWAMGMELSGPRTIEARANFMKNDVWTVHTNYHVEMQYANGVNVILDDKFENGLMFEGTEGWVFCKRGRERVTSSDPNATEPEDPRGPLRASDPKILSPLGPGAKVWPPSSNHYLNWLEGIAHNREPIAPISQSARSLEACAAAWIGMKLGRKLTWDPDTEMFVGDAEANAMRERKARSAQYDFRAIIKKAGLHHRLRSPHEIGS